MKRLCLLLALIFFASLLTACSHQPVETTATLGQTTGETAVSTIETTVDTTTETPITPPVVDPWKTAVYSKEPWWENGIALNNSLENASDGSLIIANNILMQENDVLLAVEAIVISDNLKTYEDKIEFFSSFGFEIFVNQDKGYHYGLHIPLLLASKEQLMSISFSKEYKVGFNLAFASKVFYEELFVSSYHGLAYKYEEDDEYTVYLSLKNPSGHFYVSPEEAKVLWPIVCEKHAIPSPPDWKDRLDSDRLLYITGKQLYAMLTSDGFFDDIEILIAYGHVEAQPM